MQDTFNISGKTQKQLDVLLMEEVSRFTCNLEKCKALLAAGASAVPLDSCNNSTLLWAAYWAHTDLAIALADAGAPLDSQDSCGMTAVMWAAYKGDTKLFKHLCTKGARLDLTDMEQRTIRKIAHQGNNPEGIIPCIEAALKERKEKKIAVDRNTAAVAQYIANHMPLLEPLPRARTIRFK